MVIRGDLERENEAAAGQEDSSPGRSPQRPGTAKETRAAAPPMQGFQKCPYLAGRPPCGTHHMFPSGTNVCWAEPGEEKPYRTLSRETQDLHCFAGTEAQSGCERYQRAVTAALPLPRFELPRADRAAGSDWIVPPGQRPHHRPDEKARARLLFYLSWTAPLIFALLLLGLLLR
jgi:hypothetical protein